MNKIFIKYSKFIIYKFISHNFFKLNKKNKKNINETIKND